MQNDGTHSYSQVDMVFCKQSITDQVLETMKNQRPLKPSTRCMYKVLANERSVISVFLDLKKAHDMFHRDAR